MANFTGKIGTPTDGFTLKVDYTYTQNEAGNYSTITSIKGSVKKNDSTFVPTNTSKVAKITIERLTDSGTWTTVKTLSNTGSYSFSGVSVSTYLEFVSGTNIQIPHKTDGSQQIRIKFEVDGKLSSYYPKGSVTKTITLTSIPRATTPSLSTDILVLGEPITINTPRAVDRFTHELYYEVAGKSAKTQFAVGVTTSYTWEDTLFLANFIDTTESGIVTIHCETYDGDTLIGKKSVTFTGEVPSSIVPSIETFTISEYVTDVANKIGKYVKGKSQLKIDVSASGHYGSTITSYKIVANGETFNSSSAVTSILTTAGVNSISVIATDSRGRETLQGKTINVVDYFAPKAGGLSVYRCNSDGTLNDEGVYVKAYINYEIAPIDNLNSKKAMIQYLNGETWTTVATFTDSYTASSRNHVITNTEFNVDNTYEFRLVVEDLFSSDEWNALPLLPSYTLMNYHQSGKAIGFGKVATREEGFQFGDFMYDQWDTVITNGLAVYGGDPDTTLESLIMTSTNSPNGEAMFFFTFFSSNKSESQNCGQLAVPYYYNGTQSVYWRYRFGGSWSEWKRLVNASEIGNLSDLETDYKGSIVSAINSVNSKVDDTGWKDLTPAVGTWSYLQYRKIGNQVFIRGRASAYGWSTNNKVLATLPSEITPSITHYEYSFIGGVRMGRVGVNNLSQLFYDWSRNISDGSEYSTSNWHQFNFSYFLD